MNDLRLPFPMSARLNARWAVAVRALAAVVGGYGVAALWGSVMAAGLSRIKGVATSGAIVTGMLSSFIICVCVVMWVFAARDLKRMALGLLVPVVVLGGTLWLLLVTA